MSTSTSWSYAQIGTSGGVHFIRTYDLDITSTDQNRYDTWLDEYSSDIDEYLSAANQEHILKLC